MKGVPAKSNKKATKNKFCFQGSSDEADYCSLPDCRPHSMPEDDQHTGMSPTEGEAHKDNFLGETSLNLKTI